MKRILIPTDFSEVALKALNAAHSLAKKSGSEIMLLHVIEDSTDRSMKIMGEVNYSPEENIYLIKLMERAKEKMEALMGDSKYADITLNYRIEIGNPFEKIGEVIAENNASLIIQGSTGASGLRGFLVGSNADKVIRFAKCPVITVKNECDLSSIKSIVFATDMRSDQHKIIADLVEMQKYFNAHLHLVKTYDSDFILEKDVTRRLEEFAQKEGLDDYSVTAVRDSDEVDGILEFADEINADILALATHATRGLDSLFTGMVSKRTVNRSMKPVWTKSIAD